MDCLQDNNNNTVKNRNHSEEVLTVYFKELFTQPPTVENNGIFPLKPHTISQQQNDSLTLIPSNKEIWDVVKHLKPNKAPRPDGFLVSFFKNN